MRGLNVIVTDEATDTVYVDGPRFLITVTEADIKLITTRDLDREGIKVLTEALEVAERIHIDMWLKAGRERSDA